MENLSAYLFYNFSGRKPIIIDYDLVAARPKLIMADVLQVAINFEKVLGNVFSVLEYLRVC